MTSPWPRRLRSAVLGAAIAATVVGGGLALPEVAWQFRQWRACQDSTTDYRIGLAGGQSGMTLSRLERDRRDECQHMARWSWL